MQRLHCKPMTDISGFSQIKKPSNNWLKETKQREVVKQNAPLKPNAEIDVRILFSRNNAKLSNCSYEVV